MTWFRIVFKKLLLASITICTILASVKMITLRLTSRSTFLSSCNLKLFLPRRNRETQ